MTSPRSFLHLLLALGLTAVPFGSGASVAVASPSGSWGDVAHEPAPAAGMSGSAARGVPELGGGKGDRQASAVLAGSTAAALCGLPTPNRIGVPSALATPATALYLSHCAFLL